jgi:hypothetical protein
LTKVSKATLRGELKVKGRMGVKTIEEERRSEGTFSLRTNSQAS